MAKKRKLKPQKSRKPDESLKIIEIQRAVSDEIGVPKTEVARVMTSYFKHVRQGILDKKTVYLPKIGILYPCLAPPRRNVATGEDFDNSERVDLPAKYRARLQISGTLKEDVAEMEVTKQDIDDMYH